MSYKGTPLSSQIVWLEQRIEQLESGPGGIMEMKQTIADKEKRIAELENELAGRVVWTENYGQGSEPWLKDKK